LSIKPTEYWKKQRRSGTDRASRGHGDPKKLVFRWFL